jgi:hypothetical protein
LNRWVELTYHSNEKEGEVSKTVIHVSKGYVLTCNALIFASEYTALKSAADSTAITSHAHFNPGYTIQSNELWLVIDKVTHPLYGEEVP